MHMENLLLLVFLNIGVNIEIVYEVKIIFEVFERFIYWFSLILFIIILFIKIFVDELTKLI